MIQGTYEQTARRLTAWHGSQLGCAQRPRSTASGPMRRMNPGEAAYRPDVDGLRAIAVAAVMGYHAFPQLMSGGFVGVDIFFVISGFLISGTILRELDAQKFSFTSFYARRVRRIFPSLVVVLVASFVLGWMFLIPEEFASLGKNIFGGAAFISNIVLLGESSYFDIAATRKALLHLWSLGIEEQFYLLWPVMLVTIVKRGLRGPWLIAILLAVSFALNIARIASRPGATFYLLDTRAWELLAGCLLATIWGGGNRVAIADDRSRIFANVCSLLGVASIAASVFGLSHESSFPGWVALLPTAGAFLLISSGGAWTASGNRGVLPAGRAAPVDSRANDVPGRPAKSCRRFLARQGAGVGIRIHLGATCDVQRGGMSSQSRTGRGRCHRVRFRPSHASRLEIPRERNHAADIANGRGRRASVALSRARVRSGHTHLDHHVSSSASAHWVAGTSERSVLPQEAAGNCSIVDAARDR